jgi:hypothetical protein
MVTIPDLEPRVARVLESFPLAIRPKLIALRLLIYETADSTGGVGPITETLKWAAATQYAMYFHCQTNLVDSFRTLFPNELRFDGNRAIIFAHSDTVPRAELSSRIAMALTYHRKETSAPRR